ncbi:hypothetical protein JCM16303_005493 [Sporobolomyces ruberrimus]
MAHQSEPRPERASRRRADSPPPRDLPPRRSLPIRPQTSSPPSLDYIPPSRSRGRHERRDSEEYLSADAATRIMMQKWDLLDSTYPSSSSRRGRHEKTTRSNSVPPIGGMGRRKSRVKEWEEWKGESERIRIAQVETERRLDEEAKERQLESIEREESIEEEKVGGEGKKKKLRERKSTPRYPKLGEKLGSDLEGDESSPGSTTAVYEESEVERRPRSARGRRAHEEVKVVPQEPVPSRSRRRGPRPDRTPSPVPIDSRKPNSDVEPNPPFSATHSSPPANRSRSSRRKPKPTSPAPKFSASPPKLPSQRFRSSRRKPRPTSHTPEPSTASTAPTSPPPRSSRRTRSSRTRRRPSPSRPPPPLPPMRQSSPPTPSPGPEPDLLASATHAAEQVTEAVTNAFNRVLPGFFGTR